MEKEEFLSILHLFDILKPKIPKSLPILYLDYYLNVEFALSFQSFNIELRKR